MGTVDLILHASFRPYSGCPVWLTYASGSMYTHALDCVVIHVAVARMAVLCRGDIRFLRPVLGKWPESDVVNAPVESSC